MKILKIILVILVWCGLYASITFAEPQAPKKPCPYNEEEVAYENKKAGIKLRGSLTLPRSKGPFPAVLLVAGSGPQDRNESGYGHRPFLVLADYLTRDGIAVLRSDKRGFDKSIIDFFQATTEDFASDALAGIEYLKNRKEVDPNKIGIIGHSEGGLIAPMVAGQSADVAYIIMMAAPCSTGEEIIYMQDALIAKTNGASLDTISKNHTFKAQICAVVKRPKDDATAEKEIRKILADGLGRFSEKEKQQLGYSQTDWEFKLRLFLSPWFRFFLTYDPKPALMKVKCPVLAINGELDLQVPPKENLSVIEKVIKAGGNTHYVVKELPNLNHYFQTAQTGAESEYAKIEETISPTALKLIDSWILEQSAAGGKKVIAEPGKETKKLSSSDPD